MTLTDTASDGFPRIYTFGEIDFHKVLVMDLLGPSLETLFQSCGRCFSIKTVAMLAQQMVRHDYCPFRPFHVLASPHLTPFLAWPINS